MQAAAHTRPPVRTAPRRRPGYVPAAALASALVVGAILWVEGSGEPGLRMAIRATARMGAPVFALAFAASALRRLWPSPFTATLVRNRRALGLSFALIHGVHLGLIAALIALDPARFYADGRTLSGDVPAFLAAATVGLLALTSNDVAVRALGPRGWKWLHQVGAHFIWIAFFTSFGGRAPDSVLYAAFTALLGLALATRVAALVKGRLAA